MSVATEQEAVILISQMCEPGAKGSFNLTKWTSNRMDVIDTFQIDNILKDIQRLNLDCDDIPMGNVLGVSVESDCFEFNISTTNSAATRRNSLSVISSIYDPLGWLRYL